MAVTADTRHLYTAVVALIAAERLVELRISRRNLRAAKLRGALEAGAADYPWMVGLHATFLVACSLEVFVCGRPWIPWLGGSMAVVVAASMSMRYWVIASLAGRWTTRAVFVPGDRLVTSGPFRWMRHPNYAAVIAEMAALPLLHSAWLTAIVWSAANAMLLRRRIRAEEQLLARCAAVPWKGAHDRT